MLNVTHKSNTGSKTFKVQKEKQRKNAAVSFKKRKKSEDPRLY